MKTADTDSVRIPNTFTRENVELLLGLCYETAEDLVRFTIHRSYKPRRGCETVLLFSQAHGPETLVASVHTAADGYLIKVLCQRAELMR